eukprot:CAMPEP_0170532956 /NCGR_PEP_ID=MMETSP0209-20121228/77461_1 /TAXON_ID=665100 ORGANISM="Litonotus pictus, Strain P1" /NCGR_SAMPLE_ID=MMETSP0209 /ASSEMBLY_ACC=CAM_ASM_000301 /LENGTH=273 /DNA_ID=CAMNT_0010829879 /DNA_START=121 /DNA_END=942 /DNA_ORIENTATION=+
MFLPDETKFKDFRAVVYIFHGMAGHSNSLAIIAKRFTEIGCICVAHDYRGHGLSEGSVKDIESFEDLISDSNVFINETENYLRKKYLVENNEKSIEFVSNKFICGMSLGGLLCFYLSVDNPKMFKGVIFLCPAVDTHEGGCMKFLVSMVACCCPGIQLPKNTKESLECKNPAYFEEKDPLIFDYNATFRTGDIIVCKMKEVQELFGKYEAPMVIVIPGVDKMVPAPKMYEFFEKSNSQNKEVHFYENMWHNVYAEQEVVEISERLAKWIEERS